jgi:hypothetical protein
LNNYGVHRIYAITRAESDESPPFARSAGLTPDRPRRIAGG